MINKVILLANLGKDPELRQTTNGVSVATINVATSKKFTDKNGNQQQVTTWHRCVIWNKQAEIAAKYLKKGSQVFIEGEIQHREYEQDNQKKYITEIIVKNFQMIGSAPQENQQQEFEDYSQESNFDDNSEVPF